MPILNWLESWLLLLLMLLAWISNFWANQYYGIPTSEAHDRIAAGLLVTETFILILPIPLLVVLIIAYKKSHGEKRNEDHDKDE